METNAVFLPTKEEFHYYGGLSTAGVIQQID